MKTTRVFPGGVGARLGGEGTEPGTGPGTGWTREAWGHARATARRRAGCLLLACPSPSPRHQTHVRPPAAPRVAVSEAGQWEVTSSRAGAPRWDVASSHGDPGAPPPRPPSVGTGEGAVCDPGRGPRQARGLRAPDSGCQLGTGHRAPAVPATRPAPTWCSSSAGAGRPCPNILS